MFKKRNSLNAKWYAACKRNPKKAAAFYVILIAGTMYPVMHDALEEGV